MILFFPRSEFIFLAFSQKATFISPNNINRIVSNTDVCEVVTAALSSKWCVPRKVNGLLGDVLCLSVYLLTSSPKLRDGFQMKDKYL